MVGLIEKDCFFSGYYETAVPTKILTPYGNTAQGLQQNNWKWPEAGACISTGYNLWAS